MRIDRLDRFLFPRQHQIFTLLEQLADKIDTAAGVFGELRTATTPSQIESVASRLRPIETDADGVFQRLGQPQSSPRKKHFALATWQP